MTIHADFFANGVQIQDAPKIITLNYKAQEGAFVMLSVVCTVYDAPIDSIHVFENGQIFFKGRFLKRSDADEQGLVRLSFIAKPDDVVCYNPSVSLLQGVEINDGFLWRVDPVDHDLSRFSAFDQNQTTTDITPYVFKDSKKRITARQKIDHFTVKLNAQWEQKKNGVFDLFPFIEQAFEARKALTLTPFEFMQSFPSVGVGISTSYRTGYQLVCKDLKEGQYDHVETITIGGKNYPQNVSKIIGHLFFQWQICFLRHEKAQISFKWNSAGYFEPCVETSRTLIGFHAKQEILEKGQFMESEQGKRALLQSMQQAILKGMRSQTTDCIMLKVPFDYGVRLRIGDRVCVDGVCGAVSFLKGLYTHKTAYMMVWISPNVFVDFEKQKQILDSIEFESSAPKDCFFDEAQFQAADLVKRIDVYNDASSQLNMARNRRLNNLKELRIALFNVATSVRLELLDLRNRQPLKRDYVWKGEKNVLA
ncbi:MAG: hypothetical protein CNLJKLNK_01149 [Holosporales bacterium]